MATKIGMDSDVMRQWLQSGRTARVCGLELRPRSSPHLNGAPLSIQKGQATVGFFDQVPQGNTWLLKIFTPGRRPTNEYLCAVERCLPGAVAFFSCTQRRFLTREHLDLRGSSFRNPGLADLFEGAILMPKVPGAPWAAVAEDLRDGTLEMPLSKRLKAGLALAQCADLLEAGRCSHRDLSATNVFVDSDARVWPIDFDCLRHPDLPFQPNTTVGTVGYIAPFLRTTTSHPDPVLSWCPCADRFSLAVLITEILLTGPGLGPPQEDGTLFSQAQIDEPGNPFVREIIARSKELSRPCGLLLERAFGSSAFQECPSPQEWIGALRGTLRSGQTSPNAGRQGRSRQHSVWVLCAECEGGFSMARARHDELLQKGKSILCSRCLSRQFTESSLARAQHQLDFPEVSCEHCQVKFSLPRQRLDSLRHRGKPILCPACLPAQLAKWRAEKAEHDLSHPLVVCAVCGKGFRLRKDKLEYLQSRGRSVLCRNCLTKTRDERHCTRTPASVTKTVPTLKPWDYFWRILHGRTA